MVFLLRVARFLTSSATTAKPLPCSPARAASIAALSASKFVCSAIDEISFNQLLSWLERLAVRDGLQVKSIDLSKADQAGVVRVRRLQLGKN